MPGREIHYAKLLTEYQMEKDARQSVFCVVGEMLQDGMKVIAVARKQVGRRKKITPDDEKDMTWLVICLSSMPKTDGRRIRNSTEEIKSNPEDPDRRSDSHCHYPSAAGLESLPNIS